MATAVEFLRDLLIDNWSPLSHKRPIGDNVHRFPASLAPTWVPAHHRRRLDAYKVLAAYSNNIARLFLPVVLEGNTATGFIENLQSEHREYGDADLLIDRVMAGVLGDTIELVVDGADDDIPDTPELPPEPAEETSTSPVLQQIHHARVARWEQLARDAVAEWEADIAAQPALIERQTWLRDWADDEQLNAKLVEGERDTIGLGDGVYVLAWSTGKQRPVLDIYDPGFYFPVIDDRSRDFPTKVHLAWEYIDPAGQRFVRRLTWELAPIGATPDGTPPAPIVDVPSETTWPDGATTRVDTQGRFVRRYPWNVDDRGQPVDSTVTCYFTDATWKFGDLDGRHVDDFDETRATFAPNEDGTPSRRLDLRIDFLPVLHVPNTPAHREHFGKSTLSMIAQILDDVAASDTDIQAASALAAGPIVGLSGSATLAKPTMITDGTGRQIATPATLDVRPGAVWQLGENGKLDIPDLSKGLSTLVDTNKYLREHLNVNSRVPGELTGRVSLSQAASGVSIALRFGPFNQLVGMLRLTREPKGKLLLKMVQRLGQAGGVLPAGANPDARLEFGSFLPSDRNQMVTEVTGLLGAHAISLQTAVQLLVAGGLSIEDARHEVDRIRADNPEDAVRVADATGSEVLAAQWLGMELPDSGVTPPHKPGGPPAPSPAGDRPGVDPNAPPVPPPVQ